MAILFNKKFMTDFEGFEFIFYSAITGNRDRIIDYFHLHRLNQMKDFFIFYYF